MKKLILMLLLAGITISTYGQLLQGRYSFTSRQGEEKTIVFDGKAFTIQEGNPAAARSGFFEAGRKKLELIYVSDTSTKSDYRIEMLGTVANAGNTEIEVKDGNHPFKGALLGFIQKDGAVPYRLMTDGTGNINILFSKTDNIKSLNLTAVGYHDINIPMSDLLHKRTKITATLRMAPMDSEKKRVVYVITRQTGNTIDLLDSNGKSYRLKKI
jgi:hypothetical protein